jgi:hypothetical protein
MPAEEVSVYFGGPIRFGGLIRIAAVIDQRCVDDHPMGTFENGPESENCGVMAIVAGNRYC